MGQKCYRGQNVMADNYNYTLSADELKSLPSETIQML